MSKIIVVGAGSRRDEIVEELKAKPIILDGVIFDSLEDLEVEFAEDIKDYPVSDGFRVSSMLFEEIIMKEIKLQEKLLKNKSYQEQQRDLRFISKRKKK